jgi:putative CocE/NonD family hydrolase
VGESVRLFKHLEDVGTPNQFLIIGAGPHCTLDEEEKYGDYTFGDFALGDIRYRGIDHGYEKLFLDWFDHWMAGKDNGVTSMPRVQLLVMNGGWVSGPSYPLPQMRLTPYFLGPPGGGQGFDAGALMTAAPSAAAQHAYTYDPDQPTPTHGGGCCEQANALDQRPVEVRKDVLVFSTPPLTAPVTIAGPVTVTLYVSSSAKDTDFMVKLVDVLPDGRAINLNDDALRARYRDGFDKKALMTPKSVYKLALTNMVTAARFGVGHRIRLEVASSNFPLMERNLNTGGDNFNETKWVVARNVVHVGGATPSQVVLPVVPDAPPAKH